MSGATLLADEAGELAAVRRYDILDSPRDGAFDRITALAARRFGGVKSKLVLLSKSSENGSFKRDCRFASGRAAGWRNVRLCLKLRRGNDWLSKWLASGTFRYPARGSFKIGPTL